MKDIIKLSLILGIFCTAAAFSLAGVNKITRPRIEMERKRVIKEALEHVLPAAKIITENKTIDEKTYYLGYAAEDTTQSPKGFSFIAYGQGYSSRIQTMVGVNNKGIIEAIEILFQQETPGLGAKATETRPGEDTPWFQKQFAGKFADDIKVDKDGGDIVSITGATITSRAVANSIQKGIEWLSDYVKFEKEKTITE